MQKASIRQMLVWLTAGLIMVILGYGLYDTLWHGPTSEAAKTNPSVTAEPVETPLLAVGAEAPNFILAGLDGKEYHLYEYRGKQLVLIEFFATWCPHCQHSVPELLTLYDNLSAQVEILSINAGDKPPQRSTSEAFKNQYGITYPILEWPSEELMENYHLQSFPTLYLVGKDGKILWAHKGTLLPKEREILEALIRQHA